MEIYCQVTPIIRSPPWMMELFGYRVFISGSPVYQCKCVLVCKCNILPVMYIIAITSSNPLQTVKLLFCCRRPNIRHNTCIQKVKLRQWLARSHDDTTFILCVFCEVFSLCCGGLTFLILYLCRFLHSSCNLMSNKSLRHGYWLY